MAQFKTEAIVLKQFDLGEADKIITFYTKDNGKIRAVAKGVRKTKSPISGLVLPFSFNMITFYRGRSLDRINAIESKYSFSGLREDLTKMAYASFMAELVEKVGMEDHPDEDLFSLLLTSFYRLLKAEGNNLYLLDLIFKIRILVILGIKPQLKKCIRCGDETKLSAKNYFSIEHGGLVCSQCADVWEDLFVLSGESVQILNKLIKSGLKPVKNLQPSTTAIKELNEFVDSFMIYHLDITLKSYDFLHMIKDLG